MATVVRRGVLFTFVLVAAGSPVAATNHGVTVEGTVPFALAFDIRIPAGGWFEGDLEYDLRGEYGIMLYSPFDPSHRDGAPWRGSDAKDLSPHVTASWNGQGAAIREELTGSPVGGWRWRCGSPQDENPCPLAFTLLGAASGRVESTAYRFRGPEGMVVRSTDRVGMLSPGEYDEGLSASSGALLTATANLGATARRTFEEGLFGIAFLVGDGDFTIERPDGAMLDVGEVDVMPLRWEPPGAYVMRATQVGAQLGPTLVWADVGRR